MIAQKQEPCGDDTYNQDNPSRGKFFHEVGNSGKDESDVAASEEEANEGVKLLASVGPKVQKTFLLPSPRHGGLNLTDLKAEVAKILGSFMY
ncbi:hypothetical protein QQ045_019491 [Rhodiola kirilowii]